jgi:hypothetical protein
MMLRVGVVCCGSAAGAGLASAWLAAGAVLPRRAGGRGRGSTAGDYVWLWVALLATTGQG